MKILMLNYEFPPLGGGAANANRYILEELIDRDIEIDLVTSSSEKYSEDNFSDNITIYRVNVGKESIHHWKQIEILRYMWKGLRKSIELKKKKDYDLVHAWAGFPCGLMAKMLGIPYIVGLRGSDVPGYNERFSIQYIFLRPVVKSVWRSAKEVVPNSGGLRQLAGKTMDMEMKVIPNGIDTSEFRPDYNYGGEKLEILCVSRLTPRKRVSDVIKAVEDLEGVKLTVIGEGQREKKLKGLLKNLEIENKVSFTGYVSHEKLPNKYQEADVFVIPSLNEGMSNTVLEAMASGLPIITTQTGGTDELIDKNGVVVPKKDPEAIKNHIIKYRDNPERVSRQGQKSRERAKQMSWERVVEKYLETYRFYI